MATTTTTTTPTITTVTTSWLIQHERLVLVFIVLLFAAFLGNKWLNYDASKKDAAAIVAQQQVVAAQAATATAVRNADAATAQTAQVALQYQAMIDALTRQNNSLAAAAS
jgi:hypothetical protein